MSLKEKVNTMVEKVDYNKENLADHLDFHLEKIKSIIDKYEEDKNLNAAISVLKEESGEFEFDMKNSLLKEYLDEFVSYEVYIQAVNDNPSLRVDEGYDGIDYIYQNEDGEYSPLTPELFETQMNKFLEDVSRDFQIDFIEKNEKVNKINDFGEKIGGAKKDLYTSNRELRPDVLGKLNDNEKMTIIKKDNGWRKLDYQS